MFDLVYLLAAVPVVALAVMGQHVSKRTRRAVASIRYENFRKRVLNGEYDNHPSNHSRKEQ